MPEISIVVWLEPVIIAHAQTLDTGTVAKHRRKLPRYVTVSSVCLLSIVFRGDTRAVLSTSYRDVVVRMRTDTRDEAIDLSPVGGKQVCTRQTTEKVRTCVERRQVQCSVRVATGGARMLCGTEACTRGPS